MIYAKESCVSENAFDIDHLKLEIDALEKQSLKDNFWNDTENASEILKETTRLKNILDVWQRHNNNLNDLMLLYEMASDENDEKTLEDVYKDLVNLRSSIRDDELKTMLRNEEDRLNAILSINAGAGGTEAQDWSEMLLRMYLRWAEKKGYRTKIIDYQPGDEAGIKSVSITLEGDFAYGYAKAEIGIHRLVRISPFDSGGRRHTSFASVFVYPEVNDKIIIDIDENDLRIDTYRSQGAGGQHVNKTDSAVRITHLPTGIVVQCQNERSQHKNKAMAIKYLKSRLYELRLREQNEKMNQINKTKKEIAWGSQIRSYILHPYKMIKDHRTNLEIGNVNKILDGDIDPFIESYLLS